MAAISMNEYRITWQDGAEDTLVCADITTAASDADDLDNPVTQIQRIKHNMKFVAPDVVTPVYFETSVTPQGAVDGGCIATPTAYTVLNDTPILFEAIPAAGWQFSGWYLTAPVHPDVSVNFDPDAPVSTEAKTVIEITAPAPGQTRPIEARFVPAQ